MAACPASVVTVATLLRVEPSALYQWSDTLINDAVASSEIHADFAASAELEIWIRTARSAVAPPTDRGDYDKPKTVTKRATTKQQEMLFEAIGQGNITKVQGLLNVGSLDPNFTIYGTTPVHYAAQIGNAGVLEILIAHGANIHAQNAYGIDALDATDEYIRDEHLERTQYNKVFALLMGDDYPVLQ